MEIENIKKRLIISYLSNLILIILFISSIIIEIINIKFLFIYNLIFITKINLNALKIQIQYMEMFGDYSDFLQLMEIY